MGEENEGDGASYEEKAYEPECDYSRHDVRGHLKAFGHKDPFVKLHDGDFDQCQGQLGHEERCVYQLCRNCLANLFSNMKQE